MDSGRPILTPLGDINAIFMHFPFDMVLLQALPDLPQAQTGIFFGIKLAVHPGDTPRQFVSRHIFRSIYHVPEGITAPVQAFRKLLLLPAVPEQLLHSDGFPHCSVLQFHIKRFRHRLLWHRG